MDDEDVLGGEFNVLLPKDGDAKGFKDGETQEVKFATDANKTRGAGTFLGYTEQESPYNDESVEVDGTYSVFRASRNNDNITDEDKKTFYPRAFIAAKYFMTGENDDYPILHWEYHIENRGSTNLQIGIPLVSFRHVDFTYEGRND